MAGTPRTHPTAPPPAGVDFPHEDRAALPCPEHHSSLRATERLQWAKVSKGRSETCLSANRESGAGRWRRETACLIQGDRRRGCSSNAKWTRHAPASSRGLREGLASKQIRQHKNMPGANHIHPATHHAKM